MSGVGEGGTTSPAGHSRAGIRHRFGAAGFVAEERLQSRRSPPPREIVEAVLPRGRVPGIRPMGGQAPRPGGVLEDPPLRQGSASWSGVLAAEQGAALLGRYGSTSRIRGGHRRSWGSLSSPAEPNNCHDCTDDHHRNDCTENGISFGPGKAQERGRPRRRRHAVKNHTHVVRVVVRGEDLAPSAIVGESVPLLTVSGDRCHHRVDRVRDHAHRA